jgi:hypothetical protein
LLSKDEQDLVALASHPQLAQLSRAELSSLSRRLREARDRAQTIARRQRREMRGKAAPSGAKPASDNTGSVEKSALLAAAMQRTNKETNRRRTADGKSQLVDNAQKALAAKQAAPDPAQGRPETRTAHEGMRPLPNEGEPPSGALEQEGHRPVLERSRKVR